MFCPSEGLKPYLPPMQKAMDKEMLHSECIRKFAVQLPFWILATDKVWF